MIALWGYLHINFNEPSKRFLISWNNQSTTNFCIFDLFYKKKTFFLRKGLDDDNNRGLLVGGEIRRCFSASFPATAMNICATTLFRANNSSESRRPKIATLPRSPRINRLRNQLMYNEMYLRCLGAHVIFVHLEQRFVQQVGIHRRHHKPSDDCAKAAGDG